MKARRAIVVAVVLIALGVAGWLGARALLGVHAVRADAEPLPLAAGAMSHAGLGEVLAAVVRDGRVDYGALRERERDLRRYVATLEIVGPRTEPERFPTHDDELAWYINAYNAMVLLGVLEHWPVATIREVRGPVEPIDGLGFFWAQRFVVEQRSVTLHGFEAEIRARGDARIHAAINCASASCPDLHDRPFEPAHLDAMLETVAQRFVGQDRHVMVDEARDEIVLSAIFQWFDADFAEHAARLGAGETSLDWIAHHSDARRRDALEAAREAGYAVRHAEYDWSLNSL